MKIKNVFIYLFWEQYGFRRIFAQLHLLGKLLLQWQKERALWRNQIVSDRRKVPRQLFWVSSEASTHLDALGGRVCLWQWNTVGWCLHGTEQQVESIFPQRCQKPESKRSLSKDGMQFITKCKTAFHSIVHWWARDLHLVVWKGKRRVSLSKCLWTVSLGRKNTTENSLATSSSVLLIFNKFKITC